MRERGWIYWCGGCGANVSCIDLAYVADKPNDELCETCCGVIEKQTTEHIFPSEGRPSVAACLSWCGCGDHYLIDKTMLAFIEGVGTGWTMEPALSYTYAYISDDLGWTDHGCAVGGEWLTDTGKLALERLRALVAASEVPDD